jgi:hypothetical protein
LRLGFNARLRRASFNGKPKASVLLETTPALADAFGLTLNELSQPPHAEAALSGK